jgi:DNA ligase (NAD+)
LFAIGIRFVGETVAKKLAQKFSTLDRLMKATYEELCETEEIGEKIALSVIQFFKEERNLIFIEKLKVAGLKMEAEQKKLDSSVLDGKVFVVSGVFTKVSRDELKGLIEANGGKVASSISAKTNFVLAGDKMGPAKLEKATKLGVEILDEDAFLDLIDAQ